jgi:hypothetical protein
MDYPKCFTAILINNSSYCDLIYLHGRCRQRKQDDGSQSAAKHCLAIWKRLELRIIVYEWRNWEGLKLSALLLFSIGDTKSLGDTNPASLIV